MSCACRMKSVFPSMEMHSFQVRLPHMKSLTVDCHLCIAPSRFPDPRVPWLRHCCPTPSLVEPLSWSRSNIVCTCSGSKVYLKHWVELVFGGQGCVFKSAGSHWGSRCFFTHGIAAWPCFTGHFVICVLWNGCAKCFWSDKDFGVFHLTCLVCELAQGVGEWWVGPSLSASKGCCGFRATVRVLEYYMGCGCRNRPEPQKKCQTNAPPSTHLRKRWDRGEVPGDWPSVRASTGELKAPFGGVA